MAVMVEHYLYFTTYYVLERCMDGSEQNNIGNMPSRSRSNIQGRLVAAGVKL